MGPHARAHTHCAPAASAAPRPPARADALVAFPGTSGFFSKELILDAAHEAGSPLFWIAAFVALLTPFYMTRLFVVAFLGKSRSDNASHAREVGPLMWVPLALLAILALFSGYVANCPFLAKCSPALPESAGEFHSSMVAYISLGALVFGVLAGVAAYAGKDEEPVIIPLLRNRFSFDSLYDNFLFRFFQDAFAAIVHLIDEFLINGLLVDGLSRVAVSSGNLMRKVQSGSLQGYAFAFGFGVILVIYFTVFH